ncbi:hypothetical protein EW026_g3925 [Hermanssonia centrifuga]|uniref:Uncharacterized protein n=1 Tax=Hermanssonia centrifuga TaxID=98765 RepID=A0A4S4KJT4_9APHY|nr:hypothetical protein EW026_g3925 [Hermanssonia centrifuga]
MPAAQIRAKVLLNLILCSETPSVRASLDIHVRNRKPGLPLFELKRSQYAGPLRETPSWSYGAFANVDVQHPGDCLTCDLGYHSPCAVVSTSAG